MTQPGPANLNIFRILNSTHYCAGGSQVCFFNLSFNLPGHQYQTIHIEFYLPHDGSSWDSFRDNLFDVHQGMAPTTTHSIGCDGLNSKSLSDLSSNRACDNKHWIIAAWLEYRQNDMDSTHYTLDTKPHQTS
jgi:hypothetical protein